MAIKRLVTKDIGMTLPDVPARDDEEQEEKEEKLTGLDRLNALGTGRKNSGSDPVVSSPSAGQKLTGLERLNALGSNTVDTVEDAAPKRIIDRTDAGTDWAAKGRYRPGGAMEGYTPPAWYTDDPEELERQLADLSGKADRLGSKMRITSTPLRKIKGTRDRAADYLTGMESTLGEMNTGLNSLENKLSTAKGYYSALEKKLEGLAATIQNDAATPRERQEAAGSYKATYRDYMQTVNSYNSLLRTYGDAAGKYSSLYGKYEQAYTRFAPLEEWYQAGLSAVQKDADEYDSTLREIRNTWKQYNAVRSSAGDRAKERTKEGDELADQAAHMEAYAEGREELPPSWRTVTPEEMGEWERETGNIRQQAQDLSAQARVRYNQAAEENERYKSWQHEQLLNEYAGLKNNPDWAEKSKPDAKMLEQHPQYYGVIAALTGGKSGEHTDLGYEDQDYAIINGSRDALLNEVSETGAASLGALDKSYLQQMDEEERAVYNYLYATKGKKEADVFLKELTPFLTERQRATEAETWRKYAQEDPVGASAFSVLISPTKAISRIMQAADMLATGKADKNARYNQFSHIPTEIRGEVSRKIEEDWGNTGAGSFLYNTGMSIADFLFNAAITGDLFGGGGAEEAGKLTLKSFAKGMTRPSIVLMGMEAAADSYIANRERGLDHSRAYILSAASGLIEALTENLSLETLLNPVELSSKFATFAANMGRNALAEGSEELNSDLLNWAVDAIYDVISGQNESEYKQQVRKYIQEGMSAKDAAQKVLQERFEEAALDTLGGALSGGIMSGGQSAFNWAAGTIGEQRAYSEAGKPYRSGYQDLIREGLQLPEGSEGRIAVEELLEKQAQGKRITNADLGRLVAAKEETLRAGSVASPSGLEVAALRRDAPAQAATRERLEVGSGASRGLTEGATESRMTSPAVRATEQAGTEEAKRSGNPSGLEVPTIQAAARVLNTQDVNTARAPELVVKNDGTGGVQSGQQIESAGTGAEIRSAAGTDLYDGNGRRILGESAGEQAGSLGRGSAEWRSLPQAAKAARRQNRGRSLRLEKVSPQDLGIRGGTDQKTLQVYPESEWEDDLRQIAARTERATGQPVTFVLGSIPVRNQKIGTVRGVNTGSGIIIQADNLRISAAKIAAHEAFHSFAQDDPGLVEQVKERIRKRYSREEFEAIVNRYLEKLAGAIDMNATSEADYAEIERQVLEEVLADAYAGINAWETQADQYMDTVREVVSERRETGTATERKPGMPEERYSTADEVLSRDNVDWVDNYSSIKQQLEKHANELKAMDPVAVVQYNHNPKESIVDLMMGVLPRIGGGRIKNSGVGFAFDQIGAEHINSHATGPEARAAALAAPYVAKYGKLIAGQKNHENTGLTTLTFAAPAVINGDTVNVGVVVQFTKDGRPRAVNVGLQDGGRFKIKTNEALRGTSSRVDRYGQGTALDTRNASGNTIAEAEEKSNTKFSAEDVEDQMQQLVEEHRRISAPEYREDLRNTDMDAFNRNEARRKQLRREIARLRTVGPQLRQAEAELEQRRDLEYQKQLLEDGGTAALKKNDARIRELEKKVVKLSGEEHPEGTSARQETTEEGRGSVPQQDDSIPESAAEYRERQESGSLPVSDRDRIASLTAEIKNRKNPERLMKMHVDQGPEAVAREMKQIQQMERELKDLKTPKVKQLTRKAAGDTESVPQSAAEYAQRKREGTLPRDISAENNARINELRETLAARDTEEHKAEVFNSQGAEALAAEVNAIKRMKAELNRLEQGDRPKAKPPKAQVTWAKRDLANTLMGLFSIPNYARKDMRSVIDHYADLILKNGDLDWRESIEFRRKLWESGEVLWKDEEAGEIYSWLRNSRIYAPDYVRADFGDDWNEFRKKAWGLGIYLTNDFDDAKWDSLNMELAESFPGLFDADETDPRTVLERIVQLADEGRGEKLSLGEYAAKVAGVEWASEEDMEENLDRQMDWALRTFAKQAQVEQYYKGKMGERVTREREAAAQRLDEAVAKERQRGDRRVQEAQNRGRAMLEAEKTREALRRGREKEARREAEQRKRERAVLRELQDKTLRQLQWISRNKNKFPQEMKARVEDILRDMDIYAVSMADEMHIDNATGKTWRDLADIYLEAQERDPNWMPSKDLDRIVSRLNDKKISELDPDALRNLFQAAVGLRTELYNRNNLINDLDHRTFEELYDAARGEIENAPGGYDKRLPAQYAGMQLTPMNRMEQMAGWDKRSQWYSMAKMLEQGERDSRRFQTEAKNQLGKFLQENQDWVKRADGQGKDAIWYEIEVPELLELGMGDKPIFGDTVKVYMTPAQKVELYLESKGYDNLRHMTGGRTFADRELYSQGKRAEALAQGKTIRLAPETVRNLVKDLTTEEQGLADLLEQFYNGYSKKEINRVSNLLYGYDKAMEEYYAPIYTNDNYTKSEPGVFDLTAEGVGNLKERKVSTTPSLNLSAFDAFERSVDKTGKFVGLAIPIRNMNTLLNWWGAGTSMADTITHKWGEEGLKFTQDLLTELQSGREKNTGKLDQLVNGALNKYISSVFGFNPSIVLKQFASYPLAGAYLGYENMPKWIPGAAQVDTDLISKYTGELDYRMLGYSTPETAALKDNPGILQTKGPLNWLFGGGAITWMDGFTVRTLWTWAENKVNREQPGLERGTEAQIQAGESEYYQAVAKEFEEAVSRSQPMYDTMHRSDIMRQSGAVTRAFTLFKTVPQQEYNMLRESFGELQAAKQSGDAERIREAKSKAGRTVTGILAGNLMIGAITFLNALWKNRGKKYRDDDGELTLESVMSQMGKQYFKDAAGLAIGGDAAADLIASWIFGEKLYDIDSPGIEQVNELYQALQKAGSTIGKLVQDSVQVLSRGGDWGQYMADHSDTYLSAVGDAASILGTYAAGLPVENVKAYLLGALGWMSPKIQVAYEDALDKADKSGLKGLTGDALEMRMSHILRDRTGNTEEETVSVLSRLYEAGMTEAVPPDTPSSVTVGGESRKLDPMEAQTYSSVFRDIAGGAMNELISSAEFRDASAETRKKMLTTVYDYARDQAKAAVWDDYTPDQEKAEAFIRAGGDLATWAACKAVLGTIGADKDKNGKSVSGSKKAKVMEYIDSLRIPSAQKDALFVYGAGYAESSLDDAPWHNGGGGMSGSGTVYAPVNQNWLRAPEAEKGTEGKEQRTSGLTVASIPKTERKGSGLTVATLGNKRSGS